MYNPQQFQETDLSQIKHVIEHAPLAILTAHTDDEGLVAHHLPLLLDGEETLIGHIAKNNPLHTQVNDGADVLVIFRLDDAYISPNWYPSKKNDGKQVPTWNYRIVHISGRIKFHHAEKTKRAIVGKLTKYFESLTNGKEGWKMSDAPKNYMLDQLDKIVAFDIEIIKVMGKTKLNQNKTQTDRLSVAEELNKRGLEGMATVMKNNSAEN